MSASIPACVIVALLSASGGDRGADRPPRPSRAPGEADPLAAPHMPPVNAALASERAAAFLAALNQPAPDGTGAGAAPPPSPDIPLAPPAGGPASRETDIPARPDTVAPSAQNKALAGELTPELDAAVSRGLAALANLQNADGSFGAGRFGTNVAITSLAALAFMADGHLPGRGQYGPVVEKALENILKNTTDTGLISSDSGSSPMYGHGFATLFLGEVYGMTASGGETPQAKRLHDALVRACRLIERTQNEEGGWRYNPVPYDADSSVTIAQVMALRSARNAGIEIPRRTIDRAVEYIRKCQNPDGGFMYQLPSGVSLWPRSAASVATLYYAGIYSDDSITRGLVYLRRNAMPRAANRSESHYWYGQYYTAQAMYLAGGDDWAAFWPAVRTELLARQLPSGLWSDQSFGSAYGSSMALIVLQMPKRYLPIFQK